jgi:hypothetical protein
MSALMVFSSTALMQCVHEVLIPGGNPECLSYVLWQRSSSLEDPFAVLYQESFLETQFLLRFCKCIALYAKSKSLQ